MAVGAEGSLVWGEGKEGPPEGPMGGPGAIPPPLRVGRPLIALCSGSDHIEASAAPSNLCNAGEDQGIPQKWGQLGGPPLTAQLQSQHKEPCPHAATTAPKQASPQHHLGSPHPHAGIPKPKGNTPSPPPPHKPYPLTSCPSSIPVPGEQQQPQQQDTVPKNDSETPLLRGHAGGRPRHAADPRGCHSLRSPPPALPSLLCSRVPSPPSRFPPPAPFTLPSVPMAGAHFSQAPGCVLGWAVAGRGLVLFAFIYGCVSWLSVAD